MTQERPELSGSQRKHLRGLAHSLDPVVFVGGDGVTDALVAELDRNLMAHELIKVRMLSPDDKKAMAEMLAERSRSALCGLIGHVAILYRPHPEKPRLKVGVR